jgi:hypothetical protein
VLIVFGNCAIVSLAFHPEIENLIAEIKSCRYCAKHGPNPFYEKKILQSELIYTHTTAEMPLSLSLILLCGAYHRIKLCNKIYDNYHLQKKVLFRSFDLFSLRTGVCLFFFKE